jgi:hypothetical protein
MVVRFKLDLSGVKLSRRQWTGIGPDNRDRLMRAPCGGPADAAAYRDLVVGLVETLADESVHFLEIDPQPDWSVQDRVPEPVTRNAVARGLQPPDLASWSRFSPLQRYALSKLARPDSASAKFEPALLEFQASDISEKTVRR